MGFALLAVGVRALGSVWAGTSELEHVPVEDVVVGEPLFMEQVAEELPKVAENKKNIHFLSYAQDHIVVYFKECGKKEFRPVPKIHN